eukprot:scaffold132_cov170-Amphora_coffeaeformis.AAC.17
MSSIVTLLGKVECQKIPPNNNSTDQQEQLQADVWTWKGAWAFGAADPPPPADPSSSVTPASLPFLYTFERVVDAKLTPIPSLQPPPAVSIPKDPNEQGEGKDDDTNNINNNDDDDDNDDELDEDGGEQPPTVEAQPAHNPPSNSKDDPQKNEKTRVAPSDTKMEIDTTQNVAHTTKPTEAQNKEEEKQVAVRPKADSSATEAASPKNPESKESLEIKNTEEKASANTPDTNLKTGIASTAASSKIQDATKPTENTSETIEQNQQQPEQPNGPTFGDDGFVDACTKHPACPPSGHWKGSFQAAIGRKGQQRSSIPEHFDVFLYAEPPTDAQVQFTDPKEPLKPHHVYIRGAGENQFGVFELTGSFSLETQMLKLQRLYVRIAPEPPRRGRGRKSRRSEPGSVGRSTRKRQLSWKRKAALVDETSTRTPTVGGSQASTQSGLDNQQSRPAKRQKHKRSSDEKGSLTPVTTAKSGGIPETVSTTTPTAVGTTPPKSAGTASRLASATPHGSTVVRLPVEGDVQLARWRSAHFYHYNPAPKDATASTTTTAAVSNTSTANNYTVANKSVVYEGELYNGLREGRGVCVYNNDMVYEGEWQLDKEHGFGTLWTGDKRRTIYQGEWTGGRIHGQGKYYYYDSNSDATSSGNKTQSRYEGEFRENLRHGNGMYVLPDGSTYNGQWQNGNMTGRGIFTWPDGSVYDGDWKDNQRHGNGVLKASDGFCYEGTWVHNTMEGRAVATYPDGQEYHGMFSSGRREGRGTIKFPNGAIYEGRFRDDAVDGQGTMKIRKVVLIPRDDNGDEEEETGDGEENSKAEAKSNDFMIPISFQSDMAHIHRRAGFTLGGN